MWSFHIGALWSSQPAPRMETLSAPHFFLRRIPCGRAQTASALFGVVFENRDSVLPWVAQHGA